MTRFVLQRLLGISGPVVVSAIIDSRGMPSRPQILTAVDPMLGYAAAAALREWRFEPARLDGEPVAVEYRLTVNYRIAGRRPGP